MSHSELDAGGARSSNAESLLINLETSEPGAFLGDGGRRHEMCPIHLLGFAATANADVE